MIDIIKTGFRIRFNKDVGPQPFDVYYINNNTYKFDEGLNFPKDQDGVYIFFTGTNDLVDGECRILYCGKTVDLRSRFTSHHKKEPLSKINPLYIAVLYCKNESEITKTETALLNYYDFPENEQNKGQVPTPTKLYRQ